MSVKSDTIRTLSRPTSLAKAWVILDIFCCAVPELVIYGSIIHTFIIWLFEITFALYENRSKVR